MSEEPYHSKIPDWVPPQGGDAYATRIVIAPTHLPFGQGSIGAKAQPTVDLDTLERQILSGDRVALARAITLMESRAQRHRCLADELIARLALRARPSIRVGISGVPGAGKSTFIDSLGVQLVRRGHKLAVLSVDPSSPVSGGSILGDKTRMDRLAREPNAFIRPSPNGGFLGGVARRTRETIGLCEAAGFDIIFVETVGVGQSEVLVRSMVDCFVVLTVAGAGDELQGMKKGIMELAQIVVVNKADGENRRRAEAAALEFVRALRYLNVTDDDWVPRVMTCSSLTGDRIDEVWAVVREFVDHATAVGEFERVRRRQNVAWMDDLLGQMVRELYESSPSLREKRHRMEEDVAGGRMPALHAARQLLEAVMKETLRAGVEECHNRDVLFGKKRGVDPSGLS